MREIYLRETKIKPSRNCEITLPFTDKRKSCSSREFFTSQIRILMLITKENPHKISEFIENHGGTTSKNRIVKYSCPS